MVAERPTSEKIQELSGQITYLQTKNSLSPQEAYDLTMAGLIIQTENVTRLDERLMSAENTIQDLLDRIRKLEEADGFSR